MDKELQCKYFKNGKCVFNFECNEEESTDLNCPSHSLNEEGEWGE